MNGIGEKGISYYPWCNKGKGKQIFEVEDEEKVTTVGFNSTRVGSKHSREDLG